jgi:hypothetical protein
MKKSNPQIYSLLIKGKKRYFGKTTNAKNNGELRPSVIYTNSKLRELISNDSKIEIIKESNENWRNEKIKIISEESKTNNELIHPQWMLDGLKCDPKWGYYWTGKKKDLHTINQLSKSKYIRICQYSKDGKLIKIWSGIKEAAIEIFNDYKVVNGGGKCRLFQILKNKPWNRLSNNFYWFKESEIILYFSAVLDDFNIQYFMNILKKNERQTYKKAPIKNFEIFEYYPDTNKLKEKYSNAGDAANNLKLSLTTISKYCRNKNVCQTTNTYFKYSDKKITK